jgi:ribonuclease T2
MHRFRRGLAVALLMAICLPARAEVPAEGRFVASKACPALQSIRKQTNPGDVTIEPGTAYAVIAKNQKTPTHYRIEVPGAEPSARWVAAECGTPEAAAAAAQPKSPAAQPAARGPAYVLAISWQPAFCEGNARKRECRSQTNRRFDASNFTLHGLWPQPGTNIYCGVSRRDRLASSEGDWEDIPPLRLSLRTQAALEEAMPGQQSHLDRHEWIKHGTCYPGRDPEAYYRDSLRLLADVNGSPVRQFMAANIGREVTVEEIRSRFDEAFGEGAGERVRLACRDDGGRRLVAELTIGLRGDIPGGGQMRDLILASSPTDPGCPGGIVDPVGLQ